MVKHISMLADILGNIAKNIRNVSSDHVETSIYIYLIQIWTDPKSKALLLGGLQVASAKGNINISHIFLEVTDLSENFGQRQILSM